MKPFRDRSQTITLHYRGSDYELAEIQTSGFREPEHSPYDKNPGPPGVHLTDEQPTPSSRSSALTLELPEDLVLPYETTEPGWIPRDFHVPARVLNAHRRQARADTPA